MKRRVKAKKSVRTTSKSCRKGILFCTVPKKISYGVLLIFALVGLWLVLLSAKLNNATAAYNATTNTVTPVKKAQTIVKPTVKPVKSVVAPKR